MSNICHVDLLPEHVRMAHRSMERAMRAVRVWRAMGEAHHGGLHRPHQVGEAEDLGKVRGQVGRGKEGRAVGSRC